MWAYCRSVDNYGQQAWTIKGIDRPFELRGESRLIPISIRNDETEATAQCPREVITIYAPMIYTALYIMFWIRAYPVRGQVGCGCMGPGIREFFGPCEMVSSREASAIWGP